MYSRADWLASSPHIYIYTRSFVLDTHDNVYTRLAEYQYNSNAANSEPERVMLFYDKARVDGLVRRVETPTAMTEHFVERADFLFYKYILYGKTQKTFGPADGPVSRPVLVGPRVSPNSTRALHSDLEQIINYADLGLSYVGQYINYVILIGCCIV